MKAWLADWFRHWAYKLDGRKVLTLDRADRYRVEIGYGWVKVTSLVDGQMHVGLAADKPVSVHSYGAGGAGGNATVHGSGTAVGGGGGTATGRFPRPVKHCTCSAYGDSGKTWDAARYDHKADCPAYLQPPVDCECDYWPGITGANGRITQHSVGCPQRPDTKAKP